MDFKGTFTITKPEGKLQYLYSPFKNLVDVDGVLNYLDTLNLNFESTSVNIIPQSSYDGSVNLIINDGIHKSLLINSRFNTNGDNYKICDSKASLYTEEYIAQQSVLCKLYNTIPKLTFLGVLENGNLLVGNYFFYFKYKDIDGNESEFITESGLVNIFIGLDSKSRQGFANENSYKQVRFKLSNLDLSYSKLVVYYTRATADIHENGTVLTFKIDKDYSYTKEECYITITGFEETISIPETEINVLHLHYDNHITEAVCQNRLFIGNCHVLNLNYDDLRDISLHFVPTLNTVTYNTSPVEDLFDGYHTEHYIYENVGYWPDEFYRLGIVYIFKNNQLSPVFNIRGNSELTLSTQISNYSEYEYKVNGSRHKISIRDDYSLDQNFENSKGVIHIDRKFALDKIISICINVNKDILDYLKEEHNILGYFFVRQKRIPTTLCLAYTIGIDPNSHTPLLNPNGYIYESILCKEEVEKDNYILKPTIKSYNNTALPKIGAICPEYDVNSEYYNSLFTGQSFVIDPIQYSQTKKYKLTENEYSINSNSCYYSDPGSEVLQSARLNKINIIGVEDNTKLVAILQEEPTYFSSRAGEESSVSFAYSGLDYEKYLADCEKDKITVPNSKELISENIVRGIYGPYLGTSIEYPNKGSFADYYFNIKIPNYSTDNLKDYLAIRYTDDSAYYSISDRINIFDDCTSTICYRGDCYISKFFHRFNRNFNDPAAPTNDIIVDKYTWNDKLLIENGQVVLNNNNEKSPKGLHYMNLGDLNAVKLGLWLGVCVRSSINLNIRNIDDSNIQEYSLHSVPRAFFPYHPMSTLGVYKIPEALCYNKGLEKSVSSKLNFTLPEEVTYSLSYPTRIAYSNILIQNAIENSFRVFEGLSYRDYPSIYGSITKLVELNNNLLCIFEHGIALISINERTLAGYGSGGNVYINTANVLAETMTVISDTYGSQWADSIVKTDKAVYGIDTVAKRIWRTNGSLFECISDLKVQEFLNNNITLEHGETTPIIGIRNVKSHYNKFKSDVIFTFQNDLTQDKIIWSLCYNEVLNKWITFYSWIPSFSENISNVFFSFNNTTSKIINSLSNHKGLKVWLTSHIINDEDLNQTPYTSNYEIADTTDFKFLKLNFITILKDSHNNFNYFDIESSEGLKGSNKLICKYSASELLLKILQYYRKNIDSKVYTFKDIPLEWRIISLRIHYKLNYLLNNNDAYTPIIVEGDLVIRLMFKSDYDSLTTSFWKHGLSGLMKTVGDIKPTFWYGKQHPFEFEFVVAEKPDAHKIFDNLQIISNNAEPESFHYEIVGEVYDFAKDKKNMYIRQEATKEFYQYNGSNISYNENYLTLEDKHRPLYKGSSEYDKSIIFPLYYKRVDTLNDVEDAYHYFTDDHADYSNLAGAEIKYYPLLDEFRIVNHVKGWDMNKYGRLKGNMVYKEDKWDVQINPINYIEYNEPKWEDLNGNLTNKVPIEVNQNPIPSDLVELVETNNEWNVPDSFKNGGSYEGGRGSILWPNTCKNKEAKVKDRYIKIKIRYDGTQLAVIQAIYTLYSISFS